MKRDYIKPTMRVVGIQPARIICTSGQVQSLGGDEFIWGGGGSGPGR